MAIPEDVLARLPAFGSQKPQAEAEIVSPTSKAGSATQTPAGEYLAEEAKGAIAGNAEMINAGLRLFIGAVNPMVHVAPDKFLPGFLQPGLPRKTLVNEEKLKAGSDPLAEAVAPMVRGATSMLTLPVPGMGPVKLAVLGAGSGELGEIGKYIFGGLGEMVGGDTGRKIGEPIGEIGGAAAGGYTNVIKGNVLAKGLAYPFKAGADLFKAGKSTIAAKTAGDTRNLTDIFLDNYGTLRAQTVGMMDERAAAKVADIAARDPLWQKELTKFDDAISVTGANPDKFTIGQKLANPTLTTLEAQRRLTQTQAEKALALKEGQRPEIVAAYRRIVDDSLPTTTPALAESAELFRLATMAKGVELENQASAIRGRQANWNNTELADSGAQLRTVQDAQNAIAKEDYAKRYGEVYRAAPPVDILPVLKDTKDVLRPLLAKVDTADVVPESVQKLHFIMKRAQGERAAASTEASNRPFYMRDEPQAKSTAGMYTFAELHDLSKTLSADAHADFVSGNTARMKTLNRINDALHAQMAKTTPLDVWQQFQGIQADYATKYIPRFKEGHNFNLDREATAANRAREKVTDQNVWGGYLTKNDMVDRMEQFDNAFGGTLGPRVPQAYQGLQDAVSNRYSKEVIAGGYSPEKHAKFMSEYDAALDRTPALRNDLTTTANSLDAIALNKEALKERYQAVTGMPVSKSIGPAQAAQLFTQAVADPIKMKALLNSPIANTPERAKSALKELMAHADPVQGGGYNPDKLTTLLDAGRPIHGGQSTMGMLFEKALGPVDGAAHEARLRGIAELMKREEMTNPNSLRFSANAGSAFKEAAGQSEASILTGLYNMGNGYGRTYFPLVSVGRFFNNQVQKSMQTAMEKALYDPTASAHIYELARARSNQPVSEAAVRAVIGTSKAANSMMKDLFDHGLISAQVARGAAYGLQQATQGETKEGTAKANEARRKDLLRGMVD